MKPSSELIEEVVVVGYGTMSRRDLTGAVSSVSGEVISQIPVSNVAQALTGRLAGVNITTNDGALDSDLMIRVRGGGSITQDNSPLYIVDGFPVDNIGELSSADIESIDVLKMHLPLLFMEQGGPTESLLSLQNPQRPEKRPYPTMVTPSSKRLQERLTCLAPMNLSYNNMN